MPHVLIPLDGSDLALEAVSLVLETRPSRVTLLHVLEERERPAAVETIFQAVEARGLPLAECRTLVREGRPADVILALAEDLGVSLVALSTHGRTGLNRLVLGSVAEEVARASPVPVLLRRAGSPAPPGPLLARPVIGYDGSPRAWGAVEALALLARDRLGQVTLLSALDVEPPSPDGSDELMDRLIARRRDEVLARGLQAAERARGLGLSAVALVKEGRPSTVILDAAEELGATLVVVATHGRTGLTRWVFGSVAEELLHASPRPLLVVH